MSLSPPVRRALISVSDKHYLSFLAGELTKLGVEIYSTGGTRLHLEQQGIPVRDVTDYTGFPEIMDGRVKTLHPKIHGGILCRHDREEDHRVLAEHGILTFELVVVNLYPFESTVARPEVTFDDAIEQIDIGGPSLVRGAAKNHAFTTIVTGTGQYEAVLRELISDGCTSLELRRRLAAEAYAHTAAYDAAIAAWFSRQLGTDTSELPPRITLPLVRKDALRYGENPHQRGALYTLSGEGAGTLAAGRQLHGKELSYNNWLDLDSALAIVRDLAGPAVSVIKHNNPCGAAEHEELATATRRALDGDPQSAFGGVLGFNRPVDAASAEILAEPNRFIEAIVAPAFEAAAVEILTTRPKWKASVRLVEVGQPPAAVAGAWDFRRISGGMLVQDRDNEADPLGEWKHVARPPTKSEFRDLCFAWTMVRHVKSNAITVASNATLRGAGAGQMSRVDSVEIALKKAGEHARGAVLGSDAFFPFADSIELAAQAGITACIQPGGSRNDAEVIAACEKHDIAMILTGRRHFKH